MYESTRTDSDTSDSKVPQEFDSQTPQVQFTLMTNWFEGYVTNQTVYYDEEKLKVEKKKRHEKQDRTRECVCGCEHKNTEGTIYCAQILYLVGGGSGEEECGKEGECCLPVCSQV